MLTISGCDVKKVCTWTSHSEDTRRSAIQLAYYIWVRFLFCIFTHNILHFCSIVTLSQHTLSYPGEFSRRAHFQTLVYSVDNGNQVVLYVVTWDDTWSVLLHSVLCYSMDSDKDRCHSVFFCDGSGYFYAWK